MSCGEDIQFCLVPTEAHGSNDELKDSGQELLAQPLRSNELKSLLADSERTMLIKKLSEANQQNRFLKRQALVKLAEENAKSVLPVGSRKINGKYIQSHFLSRLEAVHEKLKEQIKDVDAAQSKEVSLFWCGMAESVQVMGTFDGWCQGERAFIHRVCRFFYYVLNNINAETWKV